MKAADPEKFCKWRIVSDGIDFFRPFMGSKRVIQCHINVLKQLMRHDQQYPLITDLQDEAFRNQVRQLDIGSCVAEIFDDTQDEESHHVPLDLMVGLWISKSSVNLMVDKKERKVLSLRLWGEDITLDPNSETRASRLAKNQNQDPVHPEANRPVQHDEVKLEAEEVKPETEEVKPEAEEVKPEAGEVKPGAGEVKLEPAESKLEPAESKIEPGATASNVNHPEAPTVKTEAPIPVEEIKPDGAETSI
jgi:multisite-specific tRNA:(cytosine-C5)-methyltransferase